MGLGVGLVMLGAGIALQLAFGGGQPGVRPAAVVLTNPLFWVLLCAPVAGVGFGMFAASWRAAEVARVVGRQAGLRSEVADHKHRANLYRAAVYHAPDAMLLVGVDGAIADANAAAERVFERKRAALLGARVTDLIPAIDELDDNERTERRNPAGELLGTEWHTHGRHQDGSVFALDLQRAPIHLGPSTPPAGVSGAGPAGGLGLLVIREATTRLNAEMRMVRDALQAEHSRSADWGKTRAEYLNRLCRKLETKLRAVIDLSAGFMEPVEGNIEDTIRDAASDLLVVVDKLLNLSMTDASMQELVLEPVAIGGVIEELAHQLDPVMSRNNNVLEVKVAADVAVLTTDRQKLSHAIRNLLTNAAQYTRDGTVTIEVMVEPGRDTDWAAIYVSDTGVGLSAHELNHLFKAFSLADATSSQDLLGVGIGLALSQHCARLLGGHIAVRSTQGEGSTFTLRVPFGRNRGTAPVPPARLAGPVPPHDETPSSA